MRHSCPKRGLVSMQLDAQSDAEGNDSGAATCSNPELRWPNQRRLRAHPPTRKRDREDADDGDT